MNTACVWLRNAFAFHVYAISSKLAAVTAPAAVNALATAAGKSDSLTYCVMSGLGIAAIASFNALVVAYDVKSGLAAVIAAFIALVVAYGVRSGKAASIAAFIATVFA